MKGFLTALRPWSATVMVLALASMLPELCHATTTTESGNRVKGTGSRGKTKLLENDRYPALYTGKFGDCLGGHSQVEITGFDAAYYADNMTVMFHLTGTTKIKHDNIMGMSQTLVCISLKANCCFSVYLCGCLYGYSRRQ